MSRLSKRLQRREFAVTSELNPPKGMDLSALFDKAERLRDQVDGFNLTESHSARMTMEPKAVAHLLLDRDVEPIVQFTARDRNRIAIQADLLGAAALGIENVVFMSGDPPAKGDHPQAKPVFDCTAAEMLAAASALTEGRDWSGNPLQGAPTLMLGAVTNPAAADPGAEITNARRKIDAGARFLQTQAVFDPDAFARFVQSLGARDTALLAGIIPLKSAKMARWLNANIPGISVPESLVAEMESAAARPDGELAAGIEIAARTITALRPYCAGVHLMALGWEKHIPAILRRAGIS